ncbi:hypothetical protein GCM10007424_04870 [Flavobacterium suaedae]|uniref:DUF1508 domain-containing protein n=1 Tax=Flavobacterium suaedae TaxID=1767027 RepID=A0ABQ1JIX7_9FLAO|nr:YegP family protein [Flavobacterium suaedae]GGB67912.1 hypothetical protein GCM10007424_04870 [Flavobacterium suaedae]
MGKFVIQKKSNGLYYFTLNINGRVILNSEGYTSISGCHNGIEAVKLNSKNDSSYKLGMARNGKYYFYIKSSNGQIIATSELYDTKITIENDINKIKECGLTAHVYEKNN